MSTIQFRGARISSLNFAGNEAGAVCRIHFRSDLSRPVAERMGWGILVGESETEIVPGLGKSFPLKGELAVESMKLTPNGDLKNQVIDFIGTEAKDFKIVTKGGGSDPDEDPVETELRFTVTYPAEAAKKVLGYYLTVLGEPANLKMKVAKDAQMKLGEDSAEDEAEEAEAQAAAEEEESKPGRRAPALASVRQMQSAEE